MMTMGEPRFLGEIMEEMGGPFPMTLPQTVEQLRAAIVVNVARERERCAKIAEGWSKNPTRLEASIGIVIADQIRKGEPNAA